MTPGSDIPNHARHSRSDRQTAVSQKSVRQSGTCVAEKARDPGLSDGLIDRDLTTDRLFIESNMDGHS
jgi:hypothetical protein